MRAGQPARSLRPQASNLGRFLNEILGGLLHWKSNKRTYESEFSRLPGAITNFNMTEGANNPKAAYTDYVKIVYKWYTGILKKMHALLASSEYMEVRNVLHVLTRIVDVFPMMTYVCAHIDKKIEQIIKENEDRKDLQTLASQYHAQLKKIKPELLSVEKFTHGLIIPPLKKKDEKRDDKGKDGAPAAEAKGAAAKWLAEKETEAAEADADSPATKGRAEAGGKARADAVPAAVAPPRPSAEIASPAASPASAAPAASPRTEPPAAWTLTPSDTPTPRPPAPTNPEPPAVAASNGGDAAEVPTLRPAP